MSKHSDGQVVVNIEQNTRLYEIIGTLLACAAMGMLAYALAKSGWLEIAATGLTMFLVQLGRLLLRHGLIDVPKISGTAEGDFQQTSGFIRTAIHEFGEWQSRSPIWRLALLAATYTIIFMMARSGMKVLLGIFTNIWVSGAAAALFGAVVVFPGLFAKPLAKLKSTSTPVPVTDSTPATISTETPDHTRPAA